LFLTDTLTHSLTHLSIFLFFNDRALTTFRKETDEGEEMELHSFEVAALMNLVATDMSVEEATALIPSLSRFPEAAIDEILDLIRSTMIRIVS
jgi:DNA-directed RNA polymerase II subunit RPB4